MVNIEQWVKGDGDFLSTKVLKEMPDETVKGVITSEPVIVDKNWDGTISSKLSMDIEINKKTYTYEMAKTYARKVSIDYGEDTKAWLGKSLIFSIIPTQKGDSVFAKAVKERANNGSTPFRIRKSDEEGETDGMQVL